MAVSCSFCVWWLVLNEEQIGVLWSSCMDLCSVPDWIVLVFVYMEASVCVCGGGRGR